jgi:threonine dehydratase
MAGQGTIAVELLSQLPGLDAVFVAVGGGGLIGGIGAYCRDAKPSVEIVGCWPENSPVMWECMRAGAVIDVPERPTLSESTAGGLEPGSVTLDVCRRVIDRGVFVTEEEIAEAMRFVLETERWLIEGAAAVAVAAFQKDAARYQGKKVAIVLCGRNLSPEAYQKVFGAYDRRS